MGSGVSTEELYQVKETRPEQEPGGRRNSRRASRPSYKIRISRPSRFLKQSIESLDADSTGLKALQEEEEEPSQPQKTKTISWTCISCDYENSLSLSKDVNENEQYECDICEMEHTLVFKAKSSKVNLEKIKADLNNHDQQIVQYIQTISSSIEKEEFGVMIRLEDNLSGLIESIESRVYKLDLSQVGLVKMLFDTIIFCDSMNDCEKVIKQLHRLLVELISENHQCGVKVQILEHLSQVTEQAQLQLIRERELMIVQCMVKLIAYCSNQMQLCKKALTMAIKLTDKFHWESLLLDNNVVQVCFNVIRVVSVGQDTADQSDYLCTKTLAFELLQRLTLDVAHHQSLITQNILKRCSETLNSKKGENEFYRIECSCILAVLCSNMTIHQQLFELESSSSLLEQSIAILSSQEASLDLKVNLTSLLAHLSRNPSYHAHLVKLGVLPLCHSLLAYSECARMDVKENATVLLLNLTTIEDPQFQDSVVQICMELATSGPLDIKKNILLVLSSYLRQDGSRGELLMRHGVVESCTAVIKSRLEHIQARQMATLLLLKLSCTPELRQQLLHHGVLDLCTEYFDFAPSKGANEMTAPHVLFTTLLVQLMTLAAQADEQVLQLCKVDRLIVLLQDDEELDPKIRHSVASVLVSLCLSGLLDKALGTLRPRLLRVLGGLFPPPTDTPAETEPTNPTTDKLPQLTSLAIDKLQSAADADVTRPSSLQQELLLAKQVEVAADAATATFDVPELLATRIEAHIQLCCVNPHVYQTAECGMHARGTSTPSS